MTFLPSFRSLGALAYALAPMVLVACGSDDAVSSADTTPSASPSASPSPVPTSPGAKPRSNRFCLGEKHLFCADFDGHVLTDGFDADKPAARNAFASTPSERSAPNALTWTRRPGAATDDLRLRAQIDADAAQDPSVVEAATDLFLDPNNGRVSASVFEVLVGPSLQPKLGAALSVDGTGYTNVVLHMPRPAELGSGPLTVTSEGGPTIPLGRWVHIVLRLEKTETNWTASFDVDGVRGATAVRPATERVRTNKVRLLVGAEHVLGTEIYGEPLQAAFDNVTVDVRRD